MDINELKTILKEKGMTYEMLSEKSGISISAIKKIFSGYAKYPRIDTMETIYKTLGINKTSINYIDDIPVAIYDASKGLSDEDVEDVLKYIEFVKSKKE